MAKVAPKLIREKRRRLSIRRKISGAPGRPRLSVKRTLKHIYAQIIDDTTGQTLAAASSLGLHISGGNVGAAKIVGKALAEAAREKSITAVAFDRNGKLFHGRVKALADAAREGGLQV